MSDTCTACQRGREACEYCHDVNEQDYEAICDCGLHDFGQHLLDCRERDNHLYVIVANHESASLRR